MSMLTIQNNVGIRQILIYIPNVDINPSSMYGNYQNGVPWSDYAIDHRLVRPYRWLVVKIEPIHNTTFYHKSFVTKTTHLQIK